METVEILDKEFTFFIQSLDKEICHHPPIPPLPVRKKEKSTMKISIHCLKDLIDLANTEIDENLEYTIDFSQLHKIAPILQDIYEMIGMEKVKESVVEQILYFLFLEQSQQDYKHVLLLGPPGTGKTELAMLLGKLFLQMGVLKNNIFKKVTRNDLVSGYLGQTAIKTKEVIQQAMGGVLFIDEAYSLACSEKTDFYAKECIDTLCEAMSDSKNQLMVIAAGYETEMKYFLQSNQGLESRFLWRYVLPVYNFQELSFIFSKKVLNLGWKIEAPLKPWFQKHYPHFKAYGRDMEKLLTFVKIKHAKRIYGEEVHGHKCITLQDMDAGFQAFSEQVESKSNNLSILHSLYI